MKTKYISFLLSAILVGGLTSCDDWLDVEQNTEKPAETMFDSYSGFKGALAGCYANLAKSDLYGTRMTLSNVESLASLWVLGEAEDYLDVLEANHQLRLHNYKHTMSVEVFETLYSKLYNAALEANMIIRAFKDGKGSNIADKTSRAVVEGEAYALRAFVHLDILRLFGQMPQNATIQVQLPYSEVTGIQESLTYYNFDQYVEKLKDDLEQAKTLLKGNDPISRYTLKELNNVGDKENYPHVTLEDDFMTYRQYRLNYWAVRALEARMYMYLGDKGKAHDIALEVIGATTTDGKKVVELSSDLDYGEAVPLAQKKRNSPSESLFALYYDNLYDITFPLLYGKPVNKDEGDAGTGVKPKEHLTITDALKQDLFLGCDPNDIRSKYMWADTKTSQSFKSPTISKYYMPDNEDALNGVIPLLRLSELYLIAIEGAATVDEANRLYGDYIVSKGVPRPANKFADRQEIDTELPKEYRREFFAEGQMFYFYKRHNTQHQWSNESLAMDESLYVIPIPDTEH